MAGNFLRPSFWAGKAKAKKNSPVVWVLLVVAVLWMWGHTSGMPENSRIAPHPSPSAAAHAKP